VGFGSGHWLREAKGARLFLTLALASVPANFTILGAFIYSRLGSPSVAYPTFATWQVGSLSMALWLTAGALALLLPVTWLGFMVLARRSTARLTALYLAANAVLLMPIRDTGVVAWGILALMGVVLIGTRAAVAADGSLRTPEGITARALQVLPAIVILGRAVSFYTLNASLYAATAIAVFLVLRSVSVQCESSPCLHRFLDRLSVLPAVIAAVYVADLVTAAFSIVASAGLPVFAFTAAGFLLEISTRAVYSGAGYRRGAAGVVGAGLLANLVVHAGVTSAALCLAGGLGILVYGYLVTQRLVFTSGCVVLLAGLGYQVYHAVTVFDLGSWGSLAALGFAAILSGSLVDRYGTALKSATVLWARRFRSWEY